MRNEKVWVLSDVNSNTLNNILIQNFFLQEEQTNIKIFDKIDDIKDLHAFEFYNDNQILYYAFEDNLMAEYTKNQCTEKDIKHLDVYHLVYKFLTSVFSKISQGEDIELVIKNSLENNPVDFAILNDDGSNPQSILEADIVILGVSRTSKTPLSIYMSNLGYKVSNLPLIPEIELPQEIFQIDPESIICLTINPDRLVEIRKERLKSLGIPHDSGYADKERVLQELEYTENVIKKLGCTHFDVTHMSIEETSEKIKNIMETRKGSK